MLNIVINGEPGSGKDTFAEIVIGIARRIDGIRGRVISSVDPAKKAAAILGWDGVKDGKAREFLSILKSMSKEYYDGANRYVDGLLLDEEYQLNFIMIREPEEIESFVLRHPKETVKTVLIERPGRERFGNSSDSRVAEYGAYDVKIENIGDIDALKDLAISFYLNDCLQSIVQFGREIESAGCDFAGSEEGQ